jgi:site-specific DNA recombinase
MLVTPETRSVPVAALYARVSTNRQAQAQTVASQVAALRERAAADGSPIGTEQEYVDDGYTGASLVRPALERLRDTVALGGVEVLYVHSPDRLVRAYVHQVILLEEFAHAGIRVVFLNQVRQQTPEDELLLQVQGVIAEYERAKITERARRGRRHAASLGSVSALACAPYGYRYRGPGAGGAPARYDVALEEARVVRQVFEWVGRERIPIGEVARRLSANGIVSPTGRPRWNRSTLVMMLHNPAYHGQAAYGRTRSTPWHRTTLLRPQRGRSTYPHRPSTPEPVPAEDWITVAVPPLVEPALFAAVQEQLQENRQRRRERRSGARHLLQGLLVCGSCGYALCGMATRYQTRAGPVHTYTYYRCPGMDPQRFGGERLCHTTPLAASALDAAVWTEVRTLLEDPARLAQELQRRDAALRERLTPGERQASAGQRRKLEQGLGRLIDSYTEGLLLKEEFEPRLARLRQRLAALEEQARQEADQDATGQDLRLLLGSLDEFASKVRAGLADADWHLQREIIRALVKHIEVTSQQITIAFRVGTASAGPAPPDDPLRHCLGRHAIRTHQNLRWGPALEILDLT